MFLISICLLRAQSVILGLLGALLEGPAADCSVGDFVAKHLALQKIPSLLEHLLPKVHCTACTLTAYQNECGIMC